MALLDKLKSILGIGGSRDSDERTNTSVTVERESTDHEMVDNDQPDSDEATTDQPDSEEAAAAGTDATASSGSMTETDKPETEVATEPAEAVGPPTESVDDEPVDRDVGDVIDEAEDAEAAESDSVVSDDDTDNTDDTGNTDDTDDTDKSAVSEPSNAGADLTAIKGIGPAYSTRLEAAGIGSVDELAAADAETLAAEVDVSPKIVADWIDRAASQ